MWKFRFGGIGVLNCYNNCTFNTRYCFNLDEVVNESELNVTINDTEVTVNESVEVDSNVEEVDTEIEENVSEIKGLNLMNWLLIIVIVLVMGVVGIWFYVFKFKK